MMQRNHRSQKEAQLSDIEAELKYMNSFFVLSFPQKTKNPEKLMNPTLKQETRRRRKKKPVLSWRYGVLRENKTYQKFKSLIL